MLTEYVIMNALAIRKILKKYDKVHSSANGRKFKSKMLSKHIEILQSPWLIELGAFYINFNESHSGRNLFQTICLGLWSFFCNSCACVAASLMIFEGPQAASSDSKCPICREVGVYGKAVHTIELSLLLKKQCKGYWKERAAEEQLKLRGKRTCTGICNPRT